LIFCLANSASNSVFDSTGSNCPRWNYWRWHNVECPDNWWIAEAGWSLHFWGK